MLNQDQVEGVVRHAMTAVGGVVISLGYVGDATWQIVVGAVVTLAGVVWSIMEKNTVPVPPAPPAAPAQ